MPVAPATLTEFHPRGGRAQLSQQPSCVTLPHHEFDQVAAVQTGFDRRNGAGEEVLLRGVQQRLVGQRLATRLASTVCGTPLAYAASFGGHRMPFFRLHGGRVPDDSLVTACTLLMHMSSPEQTSPAFAVAAALIELDIRPFDRVFVTLPDGPGFADAFAGVIQHEAVPLPVNPLLAAHEIAAAAAAAGAQLILMPADRIDELSDLDAETLGTTGRFIPEALGSGSAASLNRDLGPRRSSFTDC